MNLLRSHFDYFYHKNGNNTFDYEDDKDDEDDEDDEDDKIQACLSNQIHDDDATSHAQAFASFNK